MLGMLPGLQEQQHGEKKGANKLQCRSVENVAEITRDRKGDGQGTDILEQHSAARNPEVSSFLFRLKYLPVCIAALGKAGAGGIDDAASSYSYSDVQTLSDWYSVGGLNL